jgi:predicted NACHT family NTPase
VAAALHGYILQQQSIYIAKYQLRHTQAPQTQDKGVLTQSSPTEASPTKQLEIQVKAYRTALQSDPRMIYVQILGMSRPHEVISSYVRLQIHKDPRPKYKLEPSLLEAEAQHDPNALLTASQQIAKERANTALEPEEAIRTYRRCVFVGDPGAGKTTLLKYLALQSAAERLSDVSNFPIHIDLNGFARSKIPELVEFAAG